MVKDIQQTIDDFFTSYPKKQHKKGRILIFSGEGTEHVYYLAKGRVKQYDVSERGDEIVVNVFKPPAFFPMSLAISGGEDPFIYEAETDIAFHQAPAGDAVELLRSNPEVTFDLLSRVYRGLNGILERTARLMKGNAHDRLLYEIMISSLRFGKENKDGSYTSKITEGNLAARAGLTRETVSREMGKLAKEGLVEFKNGRLRVFNLEGIKEKLDSWE